MTGRRERAAAAPAPIAADVGLVAAMSIEVGFLLDRLKNVRHYSGAGHKVIEGEHAGKVIALIVGGMGRTAARRATQLLLDGHRPRWIVSTGFAGALDPALKRNDAVMPGIIVDLDGGEFHVDVTVPEPPAPRGPRLLTGRLLTVDAIVRTAAEKAELRQQFEADVVDMETSAVAAVCLERAVRFLAIRIVSDEAGIDLPKEIATLMTRSGSYVMGAALRAIWNRPSSVKDLWALHEHAHEAADRLADVALGAVAKLPA
jgi:adenosylhomocysteine nucleosidase